MAKKIGSWSATAYLLWMFAIYPLYFNGGYDNMGEVKNNFFLISTMIGAGVMLICYLADLFIGPRMRETISFFDLALLLYGTSVFLSYAFSWDRNEALWGTDGWYMGFLPILLLCITCFLISRLWDGKKVVLWGILCASAVVFLLGICNRFSFYPIEIEYAQPDFISTLGNINWFCGYLSVIAPVGIGLFVFGRIEKSARILLGIYTLIAFMAGVSQGSNSVFLWFGALFWVLLFLSAGDKGRMERTLFTMVLWGLSGQLIRLMRLWPVGEYNYGEDSICGYFTGSTVSLWIAVLACFGLLVLRFCKRSETKETAAKAGATANLQIETLSQKGVGAKLLRRILVGVVIFVPACWLVLALVHTFYGIGFLEEYPIFMLDKYWGNGRGITLYAGAWAFAELPFLHKIIGAGPDCFSLFIYEVDGLSQMVSDYFKGARLTNAHNEILTALVNIGVLGVGSYLAVLVLSVRRCYRSNRSGMEYIPVLCVVCYLVHNMVSFAQVLNFPFLFLILGMGEALCRSQKN
ncbi:MAG: hypothetical protein IKY23_02435 [Lachnospiraceae bacterium]|nr:hypothetical protein [Lachnospiraceae bacterium]